MIHMERGVDVFNIGPGFGVPGQRKSSSGSDWKSLAMLGVSLMAILAFWSLSRARKNLGREPEAPVVDAGDFGDGQGTGLDSREVLEYRRQVLRKMEARRAEAAEAAGPGPVLAAEAPPEDALPDGALGPWEGRVPELVSPPDQAWLANEERREEAADAEFLPLLSEFKPLPYDAVRYFRAALYERVPAGKRPAFSLPSEAGTTRTVVDVSREGIVAEMPGGEKKEIAWDDVPDEAMYELALGVAKLDGESASATDALYLGQLAGLLGRDEEAAVHLKKAVDLDPDLAARTAGPQELSLNREVMDEFCWAWDDQTNPSAANSLTADGPAVFHAYQYMRTLGAARLERMAEHDPDYGKLLRFPRAAFGRVFRIEARFVKRYMMIRWTKDPEHLDAGVRTLDLCFVVDTGGASHIYLVSSAADTRRLRDGDMVIVTGVYMRRWPHRVGAGWKWRPWIAALDMKKVEIPPDPTVRALIAVVAGAAIIGTVIIFLAARRESKDSLEARERLTARRRAGRDRIRRKVEAAEEAKSTGESGAVEGPGADAGPPGGPEPGEGG